MSRAGLILCEVKFNAPRDRAAARAEAVDERPEETWLEELDWDMVESMLREDSRLICIALAKAFSWVRTNFARL